MHLYLIWYIPSEDNNSISTEQKALRQSDIPLCSSDHVHLSCSRFFRNPVSVGQDLCHELLQTPDRQFSLSRARAQPCAGQSVHQLHILNHTVKLIQFIWPGSKYGVITSLLTESGGGATPECSGNGQSAQLTPLWRRKGGRRSRYLKISQLNLINP